MSHQAADLFFTDVLRLSASYLCKRFPGSLCTTNWTRSSSLTNAFQRASSSSTPWSGKDRCVLPIHNMLTFISHKDKKHCSWDVHCVAPVACFSCLLSSPVNPSSCIPMNSSCPSPLCAVCSRAAPWTGPAHCVHLLCCRRSGCLQHHRYSHPEIVSHMHTQHTHCLNDASHQRVWFCSL